MPLHVLVDATAVPADRGGVGRYVDDLLPALERAGVRLTVAVQERDTQATGARLPRADVVAAPAATARRPVRLAWEQTGLPRLAARVGADVLHSPHYTRPVRSPVPVTVTLHDATFFSHPELHDPVKARFFRVATRGAVRRAQSLVVPSAATRDEVVRFTGAPADRFFVAHHGVDRDVFRPVTADEAARVAASLGIGPEGYVAFLGTLEPRKNVPELVRGWVAAVAGTSSPPVLVLAGGRGWDEAVDPAVAAVPAGLRVLRPGYLPLEDLSGYLGGARVVAYPSLGEGFGLPVLEAMACGAAVLTTDRLSLPEVGGDAVAYCGTGADEIAPALAALLADGARRAELARAAVERAALFTWDAAAQAHLRAFRAAVVQRR
ncbi:glycosyltransferase family 4 protein [Cellulomonas aerilata]|uniref:Glycosyl transferase n=1 Tax=Cellulomonas aerilata TaxID=515326 RepID=A0A512DDA5_9CELL|nr:glycosyltransferase family 1 protein [Cellulomonas aerilata]GEO34458.1 glycosyl transferase [Cellulomonas aerilata]